MHRRGRLCQHVEQLRRRSVPSERNRISSSINGTDARLGMKADDSTNGQTYTQPWSTGPTLEGRADPPTGVDVNQLGSKVRVFLIAVDQHAMNLGVRARHTIQRARHLVRWLEKHQQWVSA